MKNKIIISAIWAAPLCISLAANAAMSQEECILGENVPALDHCLTGSPQDFEFAIAQSCATKSYYTVTGLYGYVCVPYCTSCPSGYVLSMDTCTPTETGGSCEIIGSVAQLYYIGHMCGTLKVPTCILDPDAKCAAGEYGTAPNCKTCPSNANCPGGNGSTFYCNVGYYKYGSTCSRCPSSGGVYGTTASSGATAITACYLPSGTTGSDETGSFTYTSNCYYSN